MKIKISKIPAIPLSIFALTFKNFIIAPFYKKKLKLSTMPETPAEKPSLRDAALKKGIHLGAAVQYEQTPAYKQALYENFTSVTPENDLKWGSIRKKLSEKYDFSRADRIVDEALSNGMRVRGHALIWGKYPGLGFPSDLTHILDNSEHPKAELHNILEEHIFTVMGHYKKRISDWDVINEPFELFGTRIDKNVYYQVLGLDYIPLGFSLARQASPSGRLFLNENIFHYNGRRAKDLLKLVRDLRDKNVPFDAVGLQSHIITNLPSIKELKNYLNQLAELGVEIEVNELDASIGLFRNYRDPYKAQGELFRAIIETCLECPACKGVSFWGVDDRDNWMDVIPTLIPFKPNSPLLFDQEMRPKPAYYEVLKALTAQ
jgi:endo-1,4-beta-xylanase